MEKCHWTHRNRQRHGFAHDGVKNWRTSTNLRHYGVGLHMWYLNLANSLTGLEFIIKITWQIDSTNKGHDTSEIKWSNRLWLSWFIPKQMSRVMCGRIFNLKPVECPGVLCILKMTLVLVFVFILKPHEYCYKHFIVSTYDFFTRTINVEYK